MRLDNVPEAVGRTILALLAHFVGFPAALPWGIGVYFLVLAGLVAYVLPLPEYDHATPVPPKFAVFGLTMTAAVIYLLLRVWLRERARRAAGRSPQPSAAIVDSQSIKIGHAGGERGLRYRQEGDWPKTASAC